MVEISMKKLTEEVPNIYCCSCESLDTLFRFIKPTFYNSGLYGWNCDIYYFPFDKVAIVTGLRNLRGKSIPLSLITEYNRLAKAVLEGYEFSDKEYALRILVETFVKAVKNYEVE